MNYRQQTLKDEIDCTGIGIHSGEKVCMNIKPAPPDAGIRFIRKDLGGHPAVNACIKNVYETTLATTIKSNECRVATIEHLMAALFGLGIDNAVIELDGSEIPIMDGSAAHFVFLIKSVGIREQRKPKKFIVVKKPFFIKDGNRSISIYPSKELEISYTIDFTHPLLKNQEYKLSFSDRNFTREISRARTFGFLKDVQMLKENGFAKGGSLDNAIIVDDCKILNEDGLRFKDEFVRHKILDFIGDISLIGTPIIGRFIVDKSGHFLNQLMLKELMKSKKHWKILTFKTQEECTKNSVKIPAFNMPHAVPA